VGDWDFSFSGRHDTVDYKQKRNGEANSPCRGVRSTGLVMPRNEKGPAFVETADPSSDDGFCAVDNQTGKLTQVIVSIISSGRLVHLRFQ
jgi:hypothetical protein